MGVRCIVVAIHLLIFNGTVSLAGDDKTTKAADSVRDLNDRAQSHRELSNPRIAEMLLRQAISLDPLNAQSHAQIGQLYLDDGNTQRASAHLDVAHRELLKSDESAGHVRHQLARALDRLGRHEDAHAHYLRAIDDAQARDDRLLGADIYVSMGDAASRQGTGDEVYQYLKGADELISNTSEMEEKDRVSRRLYSTAADHEVRIGNHQDARETLVALLDMTEDRLEFLDLLHRLGLVQLELSEFDEAKRNLALAVQGLTAALGSDHERTLRALDDLKRIQETTL